MKTYKEWIDIEIEWKTQKKIPEKGDGLKNKIHCIAQGTMFNIYNQSDFSVDHLVMSMCRVFSCVVGRGCLL